MPDYSHKVSKFYTKWLGCYDPICIWPSERAARRRSCADTQEGGMEGGRGAHESYIGMYGFAICLNYSVCELWGRGFLPCVCPMCIGSQTGLFIGVEKKPVPLVRLRFGYVRFMLNFRNVPGTRSVGRLQ